MRVWYRGEPFRLFFFSSAFVSGGLQETDCVLYTCPLPIPSSHISAEAALMTQKAYAVVALPMFAREVLCEPRFMLCFGSDESHRVSLDDSVASRQLNRKMLLFIRAKNL